MVTVFEPIFSNFLTFENEAEVIKCVSELNSQLQKDGFISFDDYYVTLSQYDKCNFLRSKPMPLIACIFNYGFAIDITNKIFEYRIDNVCKKNCYIIMTPYLGSRY